MIPNCSTCGKKLKVETVRNGEPIILRCANRDCPRWAITKRPRRKKAKKPSCAGGCEFDYCETHGSAP